MKKILITGVAGFVGSTLARKMLKDNSEIELIGVDNLSRGNMERISDIKDKITFLNIDVKDLINQSNIDEIDLVIHCAAIAPLPDNQSDLFSCIEQNVAVCGALSEFTTKIGCENVIFFSSGAVYEGSGMRKCTETDDIKTTLVYPTSKYLGEKLFESLCKSYGFKVVSIRLFNLYGPNQDYFRKQPPLLGYLIKSYIKNEPITLYASEEAKRDYIYIDDLYSLIIKIMDKFAKIDAGSFIKVNAGSGKVYSVYDLVSELEKVVSSEVIYDKGNKAEFWEKYPNLFNKKLPLKKEVLISEVDKIAIADISFANDFFEWKPKVNMDEGLAECFAFAQSIIR